MDFIKDESNRVHQQEYVRVGGGCEDRRRRQVLRLSCGVVPPWEIARVAVSVAAGT